MYIYLNPSYYANIMLNAFNSMTHYAQNYAGIIGLGLLYTDRAWILLPNSYHCKTLYSESPREEFKLFLFQSWLPTHLVHVSLNGFLS